MQLHFCPHQSPFLAAYYQTRISTLPLKLDPYILRETLVPSFIIGRDIKVNERHMCSKGRDPPEPSWLQRFPRQTGFAATESEVSSLLGRTTLPFEEGAHCPGRATLGQALSAARYWRAHALLQFNLTNKRVEFGDRPYCKSKLPISSVDI